MGLFRASLFAVSVGLLATPAIAEPPQVVTDIAPVHSLVAQVMIGLGEPTLLLPPGQSPHTAGLRPSDAAALQEAELFVWIGPSLTSQLDRQAAALAPNVVRLTLMELEATSKLAVREGETFASHSDHDDDDHAHAHDGPDPHVWLSPNNAAAWLPAIAEALAAADPDNAAQYRANAAQAVDELAALQGSINAALAPAKEQSMIVFHDAYQYFEVSFSLNIAGAISSEDGRAPGAGRVLALRSMARDGAVDCVFSEPQYPSGLPETIAEGTRAEIKVLDPLGQDLPVGPDYYGALLLQLASGFATCGAAP